jgi:monovalent cation:H+ antiporter-2, CPA2 family
VTNEPTLLVNLVFAIGVAFVSALVAVRIRQSVILGYLVAGVVIGPFTPGFVGDIDVVLDLADIGIIFLMFSVGLQISLRDLLRSGTTALVGGNIQVIATLGLGYLAGIALGWTPMEALFLGAVVSNSSSTVLTKILGERGELGSDHGILTLTWSSVQDLGTILMVVVFSALAAGGDNLLLDSAWAMGMAGLFLLIAGPIGLRVVPQLFERVAALRSRELFILLVTLVALGTAYAATFFGLSLALGAFIAGVVVGESDLSYQVLGDVAPLRDIFSGLFFVSVGMLIDPSSAVREPMVVLVTVALIVLAKGGLSIVITLLSRYPSRAAILTGVALAQSGEFSFLLARLGTDLGVISQPVFSLMLAGVALSMVMAPPLHQLGGLVARRVAMGLSSSPANLPAGDGPEERLRGHAILCGYGRVGRMIAGALRRRGVPFVVIGEDPRMIRQLRDKGVRAFLGNPANTVLLDRARLDRAAVLVVATPDALEARQIVEYARRRNPHLDVVVRAHNWRERDFMLDREVGQVVMGELELALAMTRHTLHRFGDSTLEIQAFIQRLRRQITEDPLSDIVDEVDEASEAR